MYTAVIHTLRARCFWRQSCFSATDTPTGRRLLYTVTKKVYNDFVCTYGQRCSRVVSALFSEGDVALEKLDRMGVFSISKVSSRDKHRHKRVMGDGDGSVNSAGG